MAKPNEKNQGAEPANTDKRVACRIEMKRSNKFSLGGTVLVKWPSYPYWPAKITNISDKKIDVVFYGDNW